MCEIISKEEKEKAVRYLMDKIPKECLKKVLVAQNKGSLWWVPLHVDFGMYVRNALREGGFNWGSMALDDVWSNLVEEAARRVEITHAGSS